MFGGRAPVALPCRVGAIPRLAAGRQTRPADDLLASAVAAGGTAVVCQVLAGMGGVGKTQLAANLATALWEAGGVQLLVWAPATSRASLLDTYARAATELTGAGDDDPQQAARRLLDWLAAARVPWLVVLDDITDPADLDGWWPPDTRYGRTVATSRRRDAALLGGRRLIDVGVFTPDEATAYLTSRIGEAPRRLDEADQLAADLGYLPIALSQAVAYILDQDLTCAGYRARLRRRRLDRVRPSVLPDEQRHAVAGSWDLSIELADSASGGLATVVLRVAALLDPNGIPTELFNTPAALGHYRKQRGAGVDPEDAADTIRTLHRYGLADTTRDPDTGITLMRVHALVQRVAAEATPSRDRRESTICAADALVQLWPHIENNHATAHLGHLLRANTAALAVAGGEHLWHLRTGTPAVHPVSVRAGDSLGQIGQVAAARDYFRQLSTEASRRLGAGHRGALMTRSKFAYWTGKAGNPTGAATDLEQLLADYARMFGHGHRFVLDIRYGLARWSGEAGEAAAAAATFEQLLPVYVRMFGTDHRRTLAARHGLARWQGEAGDAALAVAAFERLLADYTRVIGPDDRRTLNIRFGLARWQGEAGEPVAAADSFRQLNADELRILGPDHPYTLATRHHLAYWQGMTGDPVAAADAFEQLLNDRLRVLGADHPDTLATAHQLGHWRGRVDTHAHPPTAIPR